MNRGHGVGSGCFRASLASVAPGNLPTLQTREPLINAPPRRSCSPIVEFTMRLCGQARQRLASGHGNSAEGCRDLEEDAGWPSGAERE